MVESIYANGDALYNGKKSIELPESLEGLYDIAITFLNDEDADRFIARFPKSMGILKRKISGRYNGVIKTYPYAGVHAMRHPNGITGEKNESGLKKVARFYNEAKSFLQ